MNHEYHEFELSSYLSILSPFFLGGRLWPKTHSTLTTPKTVARTPAVLCSDAAGGVWVVHFDDV